MNDLLVLLFFTISLFSLTLDESKNERKKLRKET